MTRAEILALGTQTQNRLLHATDTGQFYAVVKGSTGEDAVVVGGFVRESKLATPVENDVITITTGKDLTLKLMLNTANIARLDLIFPETALDGQTLVVIVAGTYFCDARFYWTGVGGGYVSMRLYNEETYVYQYFATEGSWEAI